MCRADFHATLGWYVLLMRRDDESVSFCRECTETDTCPSCGPNSPVTKFKRVRTLIFVPLFPNDPNTEYEVRCSCPFQPVIGAPCHHFCLFINVLPRHINMRHHKVLDVLYMRPGHEDKLKDFRSRLSHNKLIITQAERNWILRQAHKHASPTTSFRLESSVPVQKNRDGICVPEDITKMRAAESCATYLRDNTYNQGDLEEDLQLPTKRHVDQDWPEPQSPLKASAIDVLAEDLPARLFGIMNQLVDRHKNDPVATQELTLAVEDLFCKLMARCDSRGGGKPPATVTPGTKGPAMKRGAIGMRCKDFDTDTVCRRMKSSCEPDREKTKRCKVTRIGSQSVIK